MRMIAPRSSHLIHYIYIYTGQCTSTMKRQWCWICSFEPHRISPSTVGRTISPVFGRKITSRHSGEIVAAYEKEKQHARERKQLRRVSEVVGLRSSLFTDYICVYWNYCLRQYNKCTIHLKFAITHWRRYATVRTCLISDAKKTIYLHGEKYNVSTVLFRNSNMSYT